jgi:uncharacterized membrane protein YedE/YeeE
MWWCAFAGFFLSLLFVYVWGGRGIMASFALGVIAGEAFAFFNAFAVSQTPMQETYVQHPSLVAIAGLIFGATWWLAGCASLPMGFALRRFKRQKISN